MADVCGRCGKHPVHSKSWYARHFKLCLYAMMRLDCEKF